ncbi:unnamed protein product [Phytophthora lilii]|uniref:Unnamed protein product n=1 Tax=Phytophthora lilii TaxID=2077276 RepID=A0A9W6U4I6_9STRA|nr:unnamed protein product [Phytophthora lilii]
MELYRAGPEDKFESVKLELLSAESLLAEGSTTLYVLAVAVGLLEAVLTVLATLLQGRAEAHAVGQGDAAALEAAHAECEEAVESTNRCRSNSRLMFVQDFTVMVCLMKCKDNYV